MSRIEWKGMACEGTTRTGALVGLMEWIRVVSFYAYQVNGGVITMYITEGIY